MNKKHVMIFLILLTLILNLCFAQKLELHCIDVGQGDAILITYSEPGRDVVMLIDAGSRAEYPKLQSYLQSKSISKIDYLVATHPHEDHIGGMSGVINHYPIGQIYMPHASTTTKTFLNLLESIKKKNMKINRARTGVTFFFGDNVKVAFLGPVKDSYDNLNNYSAIIRVEYGEISFLLMGDAEQEAERDLLSLGIDIRSTIIKVGHHGSITSSSLDLLNAVRPVHAVISVGNNTYGHPHSATLLNLPQENTYRTDVNGSVAFITDGSKLTIAVDKRNAVVTNQEGVVFGNKNSKIFHYPSCKSVTAMSEKNIIVFPTREEAVKSGFRPCSQCAK